MKLIKQIPLTISIGTALACSGAAYAQTATSQPSAAADEVKLEEIIVTAERHSADIQKTGISVSVRNGDDLNKQGRFSLQQILEDVPNVTLPTGLVANGNTDTPGGGIIIRGVQPNGGAAGGAAVPTTATYTDGVYSGIGGDYDMDRVEILRGPQGTLYGRSATGGVVNTFSHDPEVGKFGGTGLVEAGSYDLRHAWAALNIPAGDVLAIRVAGNTYQRDGFISHEGGKVKTEAGKLKLLYKPNDDLSILVGAAEQDNHRNSGGTNISQPSPGVTTTSTSSVASAQDRFRQLWANVNWNLGFGTLTYIPAIRTWEQNAPSIIIGPFGLQLDQIQLTPSDKFITHELHIASNPGSTLTWLAGVLYYDNKISNNSTGVVVHSNGNPVFSTVLTKDTKDEGLFGEATYPFADTWRATGGVRYDKTKIANDIQYSTADAPFGPPGSSISTSTVNGEAGKKNFNNVTYRVRVEKDLTPSNMAYAMVSTGFLPGDTQTTTVPDPTNPAKSIAAVVTYDQEKLTAYELGSKNRFLADTLQVNADVFYYDYTGYQTNANLDPTTNNIGFVIVTTPAKMSGLEFDATYLITGQDQVGLTYAYLNAKYADQPASFKQVIANDTIPNIPRNAVTASYEHTFKLGASTLVFHADGRYATGYYSQNYHPAYLVPACDNLPSTQDCLAYTHVDSEVIGNLSVTWRSPSGAFGVTGYVRNVANNNYISGGNLSGYGASFNASANLYDPRTIGIALNVKL